VLGGHDASELARFGEGRDCDSCGPAVERGAGDPGGAVTVAIGLDDRDQVRLLRQVLEDAGGVGADGA